MIAAEDGENINNNPNEPEYTDAQLAILDEISNGLDMLLEKAQLLVEMRRNMIRRLESSRDCLQPKDEEVKEDE